MSNLINLGDMLVRIDNIESIDIYGTDVVVTFHSDLSNTSNHPSRYKFTSNDHECETFEELERHIRNALIDSDYDFYTIASNTKPLGEALFFPDYLFRYAEVIKQNNKIKLVVNDKVYYFSYDNSDTGIDMIKSENNRFNSAFVALAYIEHAILAERKDRESKKLGINVNKSTFTGVMG